MPFDTEISKSDVELAIILLAETKNAEQNIRRLGQELKDLSTNASKAKAILKTVGDGSVAPLNNVANSAKKASDGVAGIEPAAKKAGKSLITLDNIARTAFGTFVAMGIFLITQFVGKAITKVIDGVKQLELAIFNLAVAEKSLSEQGIDITPQDFKDIIKSVEELGLAISKIDITKGVANLATGLRDLGLSKEQLEELSKAAAIIATSKNLSMENVVGQLVGGLAKGGKGLADLDIQVDEAVIKQKALDEQLVESEEAWNNLTASQRQSIETQALYLIVLESAEDKLANLALLEDSVMIAQQNLNAAWEDATAGAGTTFAPIIVSGLNLITAALKRTEQGLLFIKIMFASWVGLIVGGMIAVRGVIDGNVRSLSEFNSLFREFGKLALEETMRMMSTPDLPEDTPTGEKPPVGNEAVENAEDIAGALEKANDEILKANLKLEQDLRDIAIDLGRKMVDITAEYAKKRADVESDYAVKIGDIQRDTANKVASIDQKAKESRAKAQADQLEKEREFQNKLKEMREDFLMDLDDALHARDARQILKLIKQYELEKLQAERKHALDQTNAKRDEQLRQASYAEERKQAQKEGADRLADAQRDYALKLAKLKADEDAEVAAAVLAANRKTEDTIRQNQDRLAIIAADLINQFNLTKQGLDAVLALYRMYYGNGGYIDQVMAGMQSTLAGQANISQIVSPNTGGGGGAHRKAEGGMMLANRPTTVTFGENKGEMEMAFFKPIGRTGRDENKIFSSLGGQGGSEMGGVVTIALDLSPDLESRIVSNTLNRTAQVITKTRRSK